MGYGLGNLARGDITTPPLSKTKFCNVLFSQPVLYQGKRKNLTQEYLMIYMTLYFSKMDSLLGQLFVILVLCIPSRMTI